MRTSTPELVAQLYRTKGKAEIIGGKMEFLPELFRPDQLEQH